MEQDLVNFPYKRNLTPKIKDLKRLKVIKPQGKLLSQIYFILIQDILYEKLGY